MLPRLAWAGSGRGDRPGRSPPRPGAIAPKWVQPASIRGSAPPSTLAQGKQVAPDLILAELVRRAPVVLGQLPDRPQIFPLGPLG